jgi:WD40 repeat protein
MSPNGAFFAVGNRMTGQIRFFEAATGKVLQELEGPKGVLQEMAFAPNGKWFTSAAANTDGDLSEVRLWRLHDVGTHELKDFGKNFSAKVNSLAFSPSGESVISADGSGHVFEQKIEDGQFGDGFVLAELRGPVRRIAIEPSRQVLAVAYGEDGQVGIWALAKPLTPAKRIATVRAHAKPITSLAFSPDGKLLISASSDSTAKVWDAATAKLVATFASEPATDALEAAVFSPDGKEIITAGDDGIVRFWNISNFVSTSSPPASAPTEAPKK